MWIDISNFLIKMKRQSSEWAWLRSKKGIVLSSNGILPWLSSFVWHIHLSLQFLRLFMPFPIDITQIERNERKKRCLLSIEYKIYIKYIEQFFLCALDLIRSECAHTRNSLLVLNQSIQFFFSLARYTFLLHCVPYTFLCTPIKSPKLPFAISYYNVYLVKFSGNRWQWQWVCDFSAYTFRTHIFFFSSRCCLVQAM